MPSMLKRKSLAEVLEQDGEVGGGGRPDAGRESWQDCLVKALVEMPSEVAERVIPSLPREVLVKALQSRDDPYVKLALKLLGLSP